MLSCSGKAETRQAEDFSAAARMEAARTCAAEVQVACRSVLKVILSTCMKRVDAGIIR